jgi:CHAD domain-containing protein
MGDEAAPLEIELKYRLVAPLGMDIILAYAAAAGFAPDGEVDEMRIRDRYVDTADGRLAAAGVAARIRHRPDGVRVTVKTPTARIGAVHRRTELESSATDSLDPSDWPASPARDAVAAHAHGSALVETVTLDQLRRFVEVTDGDTWIEISLDDVSIVADGRVLDRFEELEAELLRGDEAALATLAAAIEVDPAVSHDKGSKLERAMAALATAGIAAPGPFVDVAPDDDRTRETAALDRDVAHMVATIVGDAAAPDVPGDDATDEEAPSLAAEAGEAPAPSMGATMTSVAVRPPGKTPGVARDDLFAEAGRKILRFHFARMLAREEGTRDGTDPEELHAMRVATRRMRAAWRVFGSAYRQGRTRRMSGHLRIVGTRLGAVRDLDVLIDGLIAYAETATPADRAGIAPLIAAWETERDDARILLVRELDSVAYRQWANAYGHFVVTEGLGALPPLSPVAPARVREMAGSRLWKAFEEMRAYDSSLRWADLATLHQLRIAAKRLRYAIEFFRETLGPETSLVLPRIVALQDHLGALHDAEVSAARARAFLVESSGQITEAETAAIGRYLTSREREMGRLRRTAGRAWRGVSGVAFRRSLARAISEL